LFLAIGGASAFAATQLAKNSVGSKQLKAGAVTAPKIKDGAVTQAKISKAAQAALKGATGPQGVQGVQGSPGADGPAGPSNAYFAHGTGTSLPAVSVPAGDYFVYGQLVAERAPDEFSASRSVSGFRVVAAGPGESDHTAVSSVTFPPNTTYASATTIPVQGIVHLPQGGQIGVVLEAATNVTDLDLTAARVGSATP
jgi:hypothetical protein